MISGYGPLELLYGRPAGISLSQIASALLNWEEFVSIADEPRNVTVLFWNVGSGKSAIPCERIHAAPLDSQPDRQG